MDMICFLQRIREHGSISHRCPLSAAFPTKPDANAFIESCNDHNEMLSMPTVETPHGQRRGRDGTLNTVSLAIIMFYSTSGRFDSSFQDFFGSFQIFNSLTSILLPAKGGPFGVEGESWSSNDATSFPSHYNLA